MAEIVASWGWVPCVIVGFAIGYGNQRRVGTLWAVVPASTLMALGLAEAYLYFAIPQYFGMCGFGLNEFIDESRLVFGSAGFIASQASAALGQAVGRRMAGA
jgi:hypothetical protein